MSALTSFIGGAVGNSRYQDDRAARSLRGQQQANANDENARLEDRAARVSEREHAQRLLALANDAGVLSSNGFDIDQELLATALTKGRDARSFDPRVQALVVALGNDDAAVTNNPGFKFTQLNIGPNGLLTMGGTYADAADDEYTPGRYVTAGADPNSEAPVNFADVGTIAGMAANQYNSLWSTAGAAPLKNEISSKNKLVDANNRRGEIDNDIATAVGDATRKLNVHLNGQGPEGMKAARKLTGLLAGLSYSEQAEILGRYADQLGVPISKPSPADDPTISRKKSTRGYLGPVENSATGGTMTEVSIGVEINGVEMEIPTMVPTLTEEEINELANMELEGNAKNIPDSIKQKAVAHAKQRIAEGKSPFYQDGEDGASAGSEGGDAERVNLKEDAEALMREMQGLPPGKSRARTAGLAKAKQGASDEVKELVATQGEAEAPEEVPEEESSGILAWVEENPLDAVLLVASGALMLMPVAGAGLAIGTKVGQGIVKAAPAVRAWIKAKAKSTVSNPKYKRSAKGDMRNKAGKYAKVDDEARVVAYGKVGAVIGTGTAIKIGSEEFFKEAEDAGVPESVVKLATETADLSDEEIINGTVQVSEEAIAALKESLNLKGITSLEDMRRATTAEMQGLRAVLSVLAKDAAQAREYNNQMVNVMQTENPAYNNQELQQRKVEQQNADTSSSRAVTARRTLQRTIDEFASGEYGVSQKFVESQADVIGKLFIGEGDELLEPTVEQYTNAAMGPNGSISKLYARLVGAQKRAGNTKSYANRSNASTESDQMEQAVLAQISFGLQFVSAKSDLEWSIETDSGAALSGGDSKLSRIARDGTGGGLKILKPGTSNQDGDAFTAQQVSEFFGGNQPLIDFFYKKLDEK